MKAYWAKYTCSVSLLQLQLQLPALDALLPMRVLSVCSLQSCLLWLKIARPAHTHVLFRCVFPRACREGRDPRFDKAHNERDKDVAARRYAFVYDEVLAGERTQLRAALKVMMCQLSSVTSMFNSITAPFAADAAAYDTLHCAALLRALKR